MAVPLNNAYYSTRGGSVGNEVMKEIKKKVFQSCNRKAFLRIFVISLIFEMDLDSLFSCAGAISVDTCSDGV